MTAISSRKRVRSNNCDEESCDFMPLSKRINNLHINNTSFCNGLGYQHSISDQNEIYEASSEEWGCLAAGRECLEMNRNEPLHHSYSNGNSCQPLIQSSCDVNNTIPSQHHVSVDVSGNASGIHTPSWIDSHILSQYTPALNAADNPYYYENNKLLFALYMERLNRNGGPLY